MIDQMEHVPEFKRARQATGLTQEAAGAVIGATRRAVQEWESTPPRRNCPPAKLALFLMLTGVAARPHSERPSTS